MRRMEYFDRIDNLPILILPISFYPLHAKRSKAWYVTVHKRNDIHSNKKHKGLRIIKEILKYENMQKPIKHKWRHLYMIYTYYIDKDSDRFALSIFMHFC